MRQIQKKPLRSIPQREDGWMRLEKRLPPPGYRQSSHLTATSSQAPRGWFNESRHPLARAALGHTAVPWATPAISAGTPGAEPAAGWPRPPPCLPTVMPWPPAPSRDKCSPRPLGACRGAHLRGSSSIASASPSCWGAATPLIPMPCWKRFQRSRAENSASGSLIHTLNMDDFRHMPTGSSSFIFARWIWWRKSCRRLVCGWKLGKCANLDKISLPEILRSCLAVSI
jgi:hypothetical protein